MIIVKSSLLFIHLHELPSTYRTLTLEISRNQAYENAFFSLLAQYRPLCYIDHLLLASSYIQSVVTVCILDMICSYNI